MGVERVWLLDSGSLVIDRSHIMWNIDAGNPVRFPVFSVLIDHSDGLFLFDSGYDRGTVEEFLAAVTGHEAAHAAGHAVVEQRLGGTEQVGSARERGV